MWLRLLVILMNSYLNWSHLQQFAPMNQSSNVYQLSYYLTLWIMSNDHSQRVEYFGNTAKNDHQYPDKLRFWNWVSNVVENVRYQVNCRIWNKMFFNKTKSVKQLWNKLIYKKSFIYYKNITKGNYNIHLWNGSQSSFSQSDIIFKGNMASLLNSALGIGNS